MLKAVIKPMREGKPKGSWIWHIQDEEGNVVLKSEYSYERTEKKCIAELEKIRNMPDIVYKEVTQAHLVPVGDEPIVAKKTSQKAKPKSKPNNEPKSKSKVFNFLGRS